MYWMYWNAMISEYADFVVCVDDLTVEQLLRVVGFENTKPGPIPSNDTNTKGSPTATPKDSLLWQPHEEVLSEHIRPDLRNEIERWESLLMKVDGRHG